MWVAKCPEVGTVSQGNTVEEAVANLREATELYLEEFPRKIDIRSLFTTFDVQNIKAQKGLWKRMSKDFIRFLQQIERPKYYTYLYLK